MGTSNSYGGPSGGTPLVPTWVDGDGTGNSGQPPPAGQGAPANGDGGQDGNNPSPKIPQAPPDRNNIPSGSSDRFTNARAQFTRFVKSGGKDRSRLGKSLSSYIATSSGGSKNAARRMGSSRRAAANLISFLSAVQNQGTATALKSLNLSNLVGKPVEEIFLGVADYICPDGGNVDEGIARSAFIETIAELADSGITDLDALSLDQIQTVIEIFATHTIEERLCNDIGKNILVAADNIAAFETIQQELHDFIARSVSDAFANANIKLSNLTTGQTAHIVDKIYETAFSILQSLSEAEADNQ